MVAIVMTALKNVLAVHPAMRDSCFVLSTASAMTADASGVPSSLDEIPAAMVNPQFIVSAQIVEFFVRGDGEMLWVPVELTAMIPSDIGDRE